ncbi:MAG: hypothetical protein MUF49_21585 [Oculatellaceae cyanobacterium Prado106]|nr:hypothetical protein [Oculatellaceae cyanobacterium Prado106]
MLDFEQNALDDLVQPAVLVTIICEPLLQESIVGFLKNLKVKGYTVSQVAGEGRYEPQDLPQSVAKSESTSGETDAAVGVATLRETTVEIRVLMSKEISNVVLYALKEQQRHFAIVAYRQTVEALAER